MKVSDAVVEVAAKAAYAEAMKDYKPNPGGNWKKEMLSVRERYRANARAALEAALAASAEPPYEIDALFDALSNLEHDNYERSYSGSKNREADAGLIRAALERYVAIVAARAPAADGDARDAERYRWLRDPCSGAERVVLYCRGDYGRGLMSGSMLDAAIDDAMLAAAPEPGEGE